ncbi:MAG: DUF1343 domain-containing protein [Sphingobacteriaceae bacterium]
MRLSFLSVILFWSIIVSAQNINPIPDRIPHPGYIDVNTINGPPKGPIQTGADQTEKYIPYLQGKNVGMVINKTSIIGRKNSVDSLHALDIRIVKIFGPEHGFRSNASNGTQIANSVDPQTNIPVISLYGKKVKPTKEDLNGIDILIFDIQDVGARFYTYISTLHYVMEACAENKLELMILDRPNPNGFYVDGPVLDPKLKSFIGMHPVPIVHGMTIAEYAQMINGEGWLNNGAVCKLKIIKLKNYRHDKFYELPINPSPNLNSQRAILLYPSLCLFEGTVISLGRGTYTPFQLLGNPELKDQYRFSFTPVSIKGMSETPLHQNITCYGIDLRRYSMNKLQNATTLNLNWLIELYQAYPFKEKFFDYKQNNLMGNFDRLAGTETLREQIINHKTEEEIRLSWEPALSQYKLMRRKYLLYP